MILALILSMAPQALPGVETPTASAHNLQTKMVYMFLDPDTQAFLDARIAGTLSPPEVPPYGGPPNPLLRVGDELGIIIKVVPRDGTTTGVGGHVDFYVPDGVQVIDAAYLLPGDSVADGITGYDKVPMKGQSLIAVGAGPIGAKATAQLAGLTGTYTNILGVTEDPVTAAGLHRGTIAGVYGDTGIFYSTDPDTAYGSWQRFTGDADEVCGLAGLPGVTGKTITNNSGDVFVPCNKWDAGQMYAWGVKGTTYTGPGAATAPIVDYGDGRGNAPWGFASGVAGPQSGYAWAFDWNGWSGSPQNPPAMRAAMADTKIGPWQRIQYPGSRVALDQPGSASSVLGMGSTDASTLGVAANTLPATTDQTTSGGGPKAIRWAVGQLTNLIPEYVWVKIQVDDTAAIVNVDGCPVFNADTFGGDAGGSDNGKDHLWRYYEPSRVTWNGCVGIGKPSDLAAVSAGQTFQYKVDFYNLGTTTLTNVVVRDTLPSGVAFISAFPAQNSGPNPLIWNVGTLQPGQKFETLITVRATGSGVLTNRICVTSAELPEQCSQEDIPSGNFPLLKQNKSVSPLAVAPGGTVQYTVRIDNIGSGTTGSPVKIEEHLEAGFSYAGPLVSVIINGANVTASTTVNATDPQNPVFTLASAAGGIQAGQSLFLTFNALVAPSTDPGSYCNWYTSYTPSVPATTGSLACVTVAGGRIGDTIWRDWNGDGVQDAEEEGIAGVTVKLYESDGVTLKATTTTDANGNYFFPGLVAGTYVVEVNNGAALPGTVQTGDPDSTCPSAGCNNRHTVTLATDQQYLTADFGYQPTGAGVIGDTVFEDIGNDGVFTNLTDIGIDGVTVELYEDTDGDGVITPGVDALVATAVTDGNGNYSFTGLAEGFDYIVYVDPADTELAAYFGVNPYLASTPIPQPVPNLSGTYNDADFGFWQVEPGSIGDQVFIDNDGDSLYDPLVDTPLAGVTVDLYRDGVLVATTVSGPDGTYLFDNLGPGAYTVVVDTTDPDLPGGLFAVVQEYDVTLVAGQDYLDADFPFVSGLTKTVDLSYATAGQTLNFTLKPTSPGNDLLENVRIIDPLPAGTTYVAASANAGGTYGAYTPLPAAPGQDTAGGPAGTTTLDTAITVSTNFRNVGGSVNVTLNVKQNSGSTVNSVTPTELSINGGAATCTGPTPASANVPTGALGQNFVWSCTLTEVGEYTFSAGAENDVATFSWPEATSASVLSAPGGGPNVVTWNLGSNAPGVPGETIISGRTAGVYGLAGANKKDFSKYGVNSNAWSALSQPTNGIEKGGALTTDGAGTIWALEGNSKIFYRYNIVTGAWTPATGGGSLAQTSDNANEGGALQYLDVGGTEYVFALLGNSNRFRRYAVASNSWSNMVNTPDAVKKGGALTTDGTYIYALQGDTKKGFWRCNATTNNVAGACSGASGSWTPLANAPENVGWGGALTYVGGYIYALRGDGKTNFWRYDIAANTWSSMAPALGNVGDGGALTTDGSAYIYALQGKTKAFWRYDIAANQWTARAPANFASNVGQGGALTYDPGLNPQGYGTAIVATPSLVATGDQVTVVMRFQSSTAVNDVVPGTLTVTPTGGASCSALTGPTLLSADDDLANINDEVLYRWICTVAAPTTTPASLKFSTGGTGASPATTFPVATSRSVLVSPVLTFQATVNTPAPTSGLIENTGLLVKVGPEPNAFPSNTTSTATSGSIGDFVWNDADGDGVQDAGELGLAGVEVCVYEDDGVTLVGCAVTDANGNYRIFGLEAGDYVVRTDPATYPAGFIPTTPPELDVTLGAGVQYNNADFGLTPPGAGSIGDTIWLDANDDGVQDAAEAGLPGIGVTLEINIDGVWYPLATTVTDADGGYLFDGLVAGDYRVTVDPASTVTSPYDPAVTSTLGAAMNPTYDKDGGTATPNGVTEVSLATSSTVVDDIDFGYRWGGSIGDLVWYDTNYNGLQDETGCPGACPGAPNGTLVLYYDSNGNGQVDPGELPIGTFVTDSTGAYLFDNLPPGDYLVSLSEQEIPSPVSGNVNTMVNTIGDTQAVTLAPNTAYPDADFGVAETARVQGTLFHDVNNNGVLDGGDIVLPAGVEVTLTGTDINGDPVNLTTTTDTNGEYLFLVPPGDYTITYDPDDAAIPNPLKEANGGAETTPIEIKLTVLPGVEYGDNNFGRNYDGSVGDRVWNDADGNGVQDAGELGIPGVTVSLYAADGVTLLATKVTDDFGNYLFEGLADGTYVVKVNPATLPAGFVQTYDNAGGLDHSGQGVVSGGVADLTVDFGYEPDTSYTVSGTVWNDTDGDGVLDDGLFIENVTVCLYDDNGDLVACTETDANGDYTFPGVPNGDYTIEVVTSTLPSTAYVQTGDPDVTLDNKTSIQVNGADVDNQNFGYQEQLGSISGAVCVGSGDGLCDDPGETPGVAGVTVTLTWAGEDGIFGNGDDVVSVDTTDANGEYSFANLQPGQYTITKVNPAGYTSLADADGFSPDRISLSLGVGEDRANQDFEVQSTASIGDRIWLDEDGDGVQDAGEAGIANVTVRLYAADGTTLLAETVTDSNGNYIFAGLAADDYVVKVDTTTMPAGLAANPTYDEDGTGTAHTSAVTLASGETYTTADFGYNWVPATHSENPPAGATGAIGDRVWIDANGDGLQDPGEPGLGGVPVAIYYDPDGDGIYDTPYLGAVDQNGATGTGATMTEPDGSYVFYNLPPGAYVIVVNDGDDPTGYTQTGDPDGTLDNQTTQPVILAPGDVYVNADFGYEPSGASSTIGDLIYLDLNGDGTHDAGEPGIAGVTVALLDSNGNVIATTTTDATGNYSFPGLPAGDYTVWVNDTANVLGQLDQTGDPDATLDSRHTLTVDGTSDYLDNDFGFAPPGHILGDGLIGDTIFLDRNGDGLFDVGEGLQGVTVELYASNGTTLLATTVTDANGNYYFGGLDAATYVVKVDITTLPNGGTDLTNTVDPDAGTPHQSTVTISGGAIDLDQDFGYEADTPNTISGTIWNDSNADGTLDGPEAGRYAGVTVVLRDALGNVVASTTTDANGNFSFGGLPGGSYTVDVTDEANVLNGLWHSAGTAGDGTASGTPAGQSQSDPYTVAVGGGNGTAATVDFGYYGAPASLGNWVWFDVNQNGIQDGGEVGIAGVEVTLLVEYPNGDSVTVVTTTDANGYYSFGNLLLDESFNASTTGDPTVDGLPRYTISAATPAGYAPTLIGVGSDSAVDSNNPAGAVAAIVQGQDDVTYDFGFQGTASIGDRVWLDEDGDGVQDAGEAGIANLTVTLTGNDAAGNPVSLTTVTDANGGYLFTGLPPSGVAGYTITVAPRTGLNATYNEDTGTTTPDNATTVVLAAGVTHTTADFGYNWAPSSDVQNGTGTGAIGDRVWIDADGDGVQDPGEPGLGNIPVTLYHDPDGNGIYDTVYATTTTAADGSYIFDGLPPGAYVVEINDGDNPTGYTQTGDPDGILDNRTTTPVILAPGDVYVNADFGYKPTNVYNVSGSVYLDGNVDGTRVSEPGIAGVTVNLVDSGGNIIATATTDASGNYTFAGVPNGNYTVVVGDTANVLAQLQQSGDPDAVLDGQTPVTVTGASVGGLDFGYTPAGHEAGTGLIGDTIFLDRAGDGFDAGEGLEGVTVQLYAAGGTTLLATTVTDANGNYYFGGLADGDYVVRVVTSTLPNGGTDLTNTVDPDGGANSESAVTISGGAIDLDQDFGYQVLPGDNPNTISGTIWNDANADGTLDGPEAGRYAGVTVVLRDANGDIVATTTTNASGNFSFGGLPNGTYTVDVTDEANVLNGLWHSDGPSDGANNNSQVDPYTVTVSGGVTDETADFGYYGAPAALGNRVWDDSSDKNGIQNAGEAGLNGVKVTLTIKYFNAAPVTVVTVTGDDPSMAETQVGWYSFGNLLLDENHASSKTGTPTTSQPVYTISVETPSGYFRTLVGQGTNPMVDSDGHTGVDGLATQGQTNVKQGGGLLEFDPVPASESDPIAGYDFGFSTSPPLAILLARFEAVAQPDHVLVTWETVSEVSNAGFNLYRSLTADGERTLLGWASSQAPGSTAGAAYSFQDFDVAAGQSYWYWLEDVDLNGAATLHGPVSVAFVAPTAVALGALNADAGQGALPWMAVLAVLTLIAAATILVIRRRVLI